MLDLSNPRAFAWMEGELDYLVEEYGVDGFKFDAGDAKFYESGLFLFREIVSEQTHGIFCRAWPKYPLNEYRASWKMAGLPLAQRLRDKTPDWGDLDSLFQG